MKAKQLEGKMFCYNLGTIVFKNFKII